MRLVRALIGTYGAGRLALAVALPLLLGTALAGLGYYFWPSGERTGTLEVPRLVGYTDTGAENRAGDDFEIDVTDRTDSSEPEGYILSQDPEPGESARPGSTISVVVSTGQETAEVPDVKSKTQEEAEAALRSGGFKVDVETEESPAEDVGKVTSQTPAAGGEEEEGSTVRITVGEAPSTVEVPDLAGQDLSEADSTLSEAGLSLQYDVAASEPEDVVIEQDPSAGVAVAPDSVVRVTLSSGEEATAQEPLPTETPVVTEEPPPEETTPVVAEESSPETPGYGTVQDDTGAITVNVPSQWTDVDGGLRWTHKGADVGPALSASPNIDNFADTFDEPGVFIGVSDTLLQQYGNDRQTLFEDILVEFASYEGLDRCSSGANYPYEDAGFVGTSDVYEGCSGRQGTREVVIAAVPKAGPQYVVVVYIQLVEGDFEAEKVILRSAVFSP